MTKFLEKIVKPAWSLLAKICANLLDFLKISSLLRNFSNKPTKRHRLFRGKAGKRGQIYLLDLLKINN